MCLHVYHMRTVIAKTKKLTKILGLPVELNWINTNVPVNFRMKQRSSPERSFRILHFFIRVGKCLGTAYWNGKSDRYR